MLLVAIAATAFSAPALAQDVTLWSSSMTVKINVDNTNTIGYGSVYSGSTMDTTTFNEGGTTYTIKVLANLITTGYMEIQISPLPTATTANDWTLHIGMATLAFSSATRVVADNFNWVDATNFKRPGTPFTNDAVLAAKITKTATNTAPTASDGTVTATEDTDYTFTAANFNFADTDAGAALSSVKITSLPATGKGTLEVDGTAIAVGDLPKAVTKVDIDASKLTYSPPANANGDDYVTFQFKVNDGTDDSAAASTMTINVTAVNDLPSGKPTITGTATVGQDLTASTSGISDADGLSGVTYSYQWVLVDGGDNNISGATSSTYTLQTADEGKKVKVKVSFTDQGSTTETVTSDAYPSSGTIMGAPNTLPTASNGTVTTAEDTDYAFSAADFNFSDTDPTDTLSSVQIVTLPASGKGTLALSGTDVTASQVILAASIPSLVLPTPLPQTQTALATRVSPSR